MDTSSSTTKVICIMCGRMFPSTASLLSHRNQFHPSITDDSTGEDSDIIAGKFPCNVDECSRSFAERKHLNAHMKKDHPDCPETTVGLKQFHCKECTEGFDSRGAVIYHRQLSHPKLSKLIASTGPLKCPVENCDWAGNRKELLKRHMRRLHADISYCATFGEEKSFHCPLCGEEFTSISNLRKHYKNFEGKTTQQRSFETEEEYASWLKEVECNQHTYFVKNSCYPVRVHGQFQVSVKVCRQSGWTIKRPSKLAPGRKPIRRTSMKVNHMCSAYVKEKRFPDGHIDIEYCTDHTHDLWPRPKNPSMKPKTIFAVNDTESAICWQQLNNEEEDDASAEDKETLLNILKDLTDRVHAYFDDDNDNRVDWTDTIAMLTEVQDNFPCDVAEAKGCVQKCCVCLTAAPAQLLVKIDDKYYHDYCFQLILE